jgi:YHS domain-containing protein
MKNNLLLSAFAAVLVSVGVLASCKQETKTQGAAPAFANEIDYVCGMKVKADYTDTCTYQGKTYAFCSESCKEEFLAAPESFLKGGK